MEGQTPLNPYLDPRKKAQDAIDHAREVREAEIGCRQKRAEENACEELGHV